MNVHFKGCARCGGDLVPDPWDRDGRTLVCLQCGVEVPVSYALIRRLQTDARRQPLPRALPRAS